MKRGRPQLRASITYSFGFIPMTQPKRIEGSSSQSIFPSLLLLSFPQFHVDRDVITPSYLHDTFITSTVVWISRANPNISITDNLTFIHYGFRLGFGSRR